MQMTTVQGTANKGKNEPVLLSPFQVPDWDQQVEQLTGATFFHSTAWARVLNDAYGYEPMYICLLEEGKLKALLPFMEINSWLTGRRGVSLPFTDSVPPLCCNEAVFHELLSFAKTLAEKRRWKLWELRGGKDWLPQAPPSTTFLNHILDLQTDEKALFSTFDDSVRRAVRKAERSDLSVEFSQSLEATKTFYQLLCQTRQRHGVPPQPFRFFEAIQKHILAKNHGFAVIARQGQVPVAGGVYFHFGRHAIYKFGASDEKFQQLRANNLVMWRAIQHYATQGCSRFDFGRTSLDNQGLRRYKLNWGTRETQIQYARYNLRTSAYETAEDGSSGWHTRVFNHMPLGLSRTIGGILYPHLG